MHAMFNLNMNVWHNVLDSRVTPEDFVAVIEISKGSKKKYEFDKETGMLILSRVLYTSMQYPSNYGFIPKTISEDGDALDVLVLCSESLEPMSLVRCFPIGAVEMIDNGAKDEKIIAVPYNDPHYNSYSDVRKLPKHVTQEILHFLSVYKDLETDMVVVGAMESKAKAMKIIKISKSAYAAEFAKNNV